MTNKANGAKTKADKMLSMIDGEKIKLKLRDPEI